MYNLLWFELTENIRPRLCFDELSKVERICVTLRPLDMSIRPRDNLTESIVEESGRHDFRGVVV